MLKTAEKVTAPLIAIDLIYKYGSFKKNGCSPGRTEDAIRRLGFTF
jgi:hypothetical protein